MRFPDLKPPYTAWANEGRPIRMTKYHGYFVEVRERVTSCSTPVRERDEIIELVFNKVVPGQFKVKDVVPDPPRPPAPKVQHFPEGTFFIIWAVHHAKTIGITSLPVWNKKKGFDGDVVQLGNAVTVLADAIALAKDYGGRLGYDFDNIYYSRFL